MRKEDEEEDYLDDSKFTQNKHSSRIKTEHRPLPWQYRLTDAIQNLDSVPDHQKEVSSIPCPNTHIV